MTNIFRSVFRKTASSSIELPDAEKPLMRVLEPRILLDAAAMETARDGLETAAMSEIADDYLKQNQGDGKDAAQSDNATDADDTNLAVAPDLQVDRRNEIVFIDAAVEDIGSLLKNIDPDIEVYVLDQDSDGVEQIATIVEGRSGLTAIHIISHGGSGFLSLGSGQLDGSSITNEHVEALTRIGGALGEDGDILIYGCNFGEGYIGRQVAEQLAKITGADIAASDDLTGSESLEGDWDLEITTGAVEAEAVDASAWEGILAALTITNTNNATTLANAIFGEGVTVLDSSTPGVPDPKYSGSFNQAGTFTDGLNPVNPIVSFNDGVIFSSGNAQNINSANSSGNTSVNAAGIDNDPDFNAINGGVATYDASFLEATIIPDTDKITVQFVFGSEEYNEYVYSTFNDSIGIWINGVHYAATPDGQEISISAINHAGTVNPSFGSDSNDPNSTHDPTDGIFESANPSLFHNNAYSGGSSPYATEMDGFTYTVSITIDVIAGQQTTIKIGVADTGDTGYDSWLLVRADSFQSETIANKDEVITNVATPVTVDVLANDTDSDNQTLTVTQILGQDVVAGQLVFLSSGQLVTNPAMIADPAANLVEPAVLLNADGTLTVFPNGSTQAHDAFTYQISDPDGNTATGMVNLIISNGPVLNLDPNNSGGGLDNRGYDVLFDSVTGTPVNISDSDVSITDLDDTAMAELKINVTGILNGNSEKVKLGSKTFSLNTNSTQTTTVGGTTFSINYNRSSDVFTITRSGGGAMPIADLEALIASITYDNTRATPTQGERQFDFIVTDGTTNSNVGESTINIVSNTAPVASNDLFSVDEDNSVVIIPVSNDTDADGDTLVVAEINGTAVVAGDSVAVTNGTATFNANGTITFTPDANYNGAISFTYGVTDGMAIDTATISGTVNAVNDNPLAADDTFTTAEDSTSAAIDLLAGDSDVDGDTLNVASINGTTLTPGTAQTTSVTNGTVNVSAGGIVTFTPDANYNGAISFDYIVSDAHGGSDSGTVNGTVTAVNDAPTGMDQTISTLEDTPVFGTVVVNDVDDRLIDLVFTEGASPANGTLVINGDGSYIYTPDVDYNSVDSFTIVVTDPSGAGTEISISVNIDAVNDLPVTISEPTIAVEDGEIIEIDASGLFSDVEDDALTYEAINLPSWLTLDPGNGQLRGTVPADASQNARTEFSILARDGDGVPVTAVVSIDSTNTNPVTIGDLADQAGVELDVIYLETAGAFVDGGVDTDPLEFSATGLPDGLAIDAVTGVVSGALEGNTARVGGYLVTVTADDGQGGTVQQEFVFRVTSYQETSERYREEDTGLAPGLGDEFDENPDTGGEHAPEKPIVASTVEAQGNLRVIQSLDGVDGIILDTIHNINSLKGVVNSDGGSSPVSEQVAAIERLLQKDGASGHDGKVPGDDWNVEGLTGFSIKFDVSLDHVEGASHRESSKLLIETYVRKRVLYIDVNNTLDPESEGKVIRYSVLMANGDPLPSWIRIARDGFIIVERPVDVRNLDLTISAELDNGRIISRSVTIDASTGEVHSLLSAKNSDGATTFSNQVRSIIRDDTMSSDKLQRALSGKNSK